MARVDAELLDTMLNNAGEVSIFRARLDQQVNSIDFNLAELARTVTRLKEQLRGLEIETEAQVLNRHQDEDPRRDDFDPLELDRYSALQQFSRALAETSGDVASIQGLLETLTREAQNLLTQQARVITELQNSLMRTRMVPFQRHVQRLTRLVRQAANDTGKRAELVVQGASAELDRQMLERMVRAARAHAAQRGRARHRAAGAPRRARASRTSGSISVSLTRDGAEVVIVVTDDGGGINVKLIREKAVSLGLIDRQPKLTDEEAMQLILEPGFSTAGRVTQAAGRGVGMDVVATEVKKLGGGLFIESTAGQGVALHDPPAVHARDQPGADRARRRGESTRCRWRPSRAWCACRATSSRATSARTRRRSNTAARNTASSSSDPSSAWGRRALPEADVSMPVVLIRAGEHSTALVTDELVGSREIVVKSLGPQISGIRGIAGATILGDGRIVIILDMGSLVRSEWRARPRRRRRAGSARPAHLRAGRRRLDHRAARDAAAARAQRHARADRQGRRGRGVAAAGEHAGHHPAGHRDAAHGRLRGGRARAQRSAAEAHSDRHDHLARQREAPRAGDRARRRRLPRQALPGKPAARRDRAAGQPPQRRRRGRPPCPICATSSTACWCRWPASG